ncbi:NUDIX hydrolase [Runella limosa]|jgi:8-oxo-dGTP diphosphatase|uniref:NUDIX hydrolase n=1 Tax=Runella limosa TaxID=370978 RepID=UPI0004266359|nr:NUDIX domain-containing protein [Runella limosa]
MPDELSIYPRPSVTIDCVVFGYDGEQLSILLLNRRDEPFANQWTLPGGFLHLEETFEEAAQRILKDKTGIENLFLEQLYTFGGLSRDPRGRVLSVAYYALVNPAKYQLMVGQMANELRWFNWKQLPSLGFDHAQIAQLAQVRLAAKIHYQPIGFELLNAQFTMSELQALHECILGETLDRRNFHKRMMASGLLRSTGERREGLKSRPAELFEFIP